MRCFVLFTALALLLGAGPAPPPPAAEIDWYRGRFDDAFAEAERRNVPLFFVVLSDGEEVTHSLAKGRHAWLQVVRGDLSVNGVELAEGDGVSFSEAIEIAVKSKGESELILFDLA